MNKTHVDRTTVCIALRAGYFVYALLDCAGLYIVTGCCTVLFVLHMPAVLVCRVPQILGGTNRCYHTVRCVGRALF